MSWKRPKSISTSATNIRPRAKFSNARSPSCRRVVRCCTCGAAPVPTSAARNPRCWKASKANGACRGHRPPYPFQVGLFGLPTLINNIETLWWVRDIVEKGADWWKSQGRNDRHGLRSYSVSGRVKNPGMKLAPAGVTVRELIDEFCGGMADGHTFHAYLPGGASGGILPASMDNIPLDFGTLEKYGCFIGSAAIIILSEQDSVKGAALT